MPPNKRVEKRPVEAASDDDEGHAKKRSTKATAAQKRQVCEGLASSQRSDSERGLSTATLVNPTGPDEVAKAALKKLLRTNVIDKFEVEKCTCKGDSRASGKLVNSVGDKVHFHCKNKCLFPLCHGTTQSSYTQHVCRFKEVPATESAPKEKEKKGPVADEDIAALEQDISQLCCGKMKSLGKGLSFLRGFTTIMENHGVKMPPVSLCPKKHKKEHIPNLVKKIWRDIKSEVVENPFYGLAVDAGVIRLHHRHVLAGVLYVNGKSWTLPVIYHSDRAAFSGEQAARHLYGMLAENLGEHAPKLSFLVIDGCSVNTAMCRALNIEIGKAIADITDLGEEDWQNLFHGLVARCKHQIQIIPCLGHFLHNVAKDALKPWLATSLFKIRTLFRRVFYCSGKTSGKKGAYQGVLIDDALFALPQEVLDAKDCLFTLFRARRDVDAEKLKQYLGLVQAYSPIAKDALLRMEEKKMTGLTGHLLEIGSGLFKELDKTLNTPDKHFQAPVFGGCTRWITDIFDSISYIKTHFFVIREYVKQQVGGSDPSASLMELGELLCKTDTQDLIRSAEQFLNEGDFLRRALQKFSNLNKDVCIADAYDTLLSVKQECERLQGGFKDAYDHHWKRLTKRDKANVDFFSVARFLDPYFVVTSADKPPVEVFNNLFGDGYGFLEPDWKKWLGTKNFYEDDPEGSKDAAPSSALAWWKAIGVRKFPTMAKTAIGFLTPPAVVNEVDSFFSLIDASFNNRQTRMGQDLVTNILFIASNMEAVEEGKVEEDL